ncbi:protein Niban 2-like isoform X2 [Mugil cephalus]|uniref:protein Niban 2-like isoform X2 n=1 Tax=Mugil cephalus TaxID=48193 RepID=UPI001FB5BEE6|nr:protein Niban 2-like isoform X2 [Mugil cephalus]
MGDVISSNLNEATREMITARVGKVMGEFGRLYDQQYGVALFNKVRFDIEGGGGPQPQLLHRKIPLENKSIFSGSLVQYMEENKKWKNRFLYVPDTYNINCYDNKASHDKRLHPKATINCAGYKVLTSMEQYLDLINNNLPDVKAKVGSSPFLKCATQFPLILWHPYARHYYFCVGTENEQQKWHAVLQDCVRHSNDGLSDEDKVQTPAFTDAVRLYRQAQGNYGTWEMMCGEPSQILSNLVMECLLSELREVISPRLKGKLHERQKSWMLISAAVYSLVQGQCQAQYEVVLKRCEAARSSLETSIRTDMDQIITSKEHVTNKIRAVVLPKAEKLLKVSIQPYISSILDALMEPTSRGFFEVRDVFFRELVDMSKNILNDSTKETVAQHMEKICMLAFHPVKMQSCYEKVEQLSLEGLQQRFDVSSPSVFVQRAQILMREQMDDAVYTFEQILHQALESQGTEDLCKTIQRCQDRVIKKFDYDSSTVRKRFFREALLQIFIPYMLKQLSPPFASELPNFQELIFEDFSRFILVENIFEEVVLQSVMKDIMMAVKEAAVQRRHNLYRDSIVLSNSDPNLHLLGENPSIDWAGEYGGAQEEVDTAGDDTDGDGAQKRSRMKQVVSMIQVEGSTVVAGDSCMEVPSIDDIPEENSDDKCCQKGSEGSEQSKNPPDILNGSVLKEEEAKAEECGKDEAPVKVELTPGQAIKDDVKGEGSPPVEEQPPSNQEKSEQPLNQGESKQPLNQKESEEPLNQKESEQPLNQEESKEPLNQEPEKALNQEESKEPLTQEPEKALNQEPEKALTQEPEKTLNQEESKEPLNQEPEKASNQEPEKASNQEPDKASNQEPQKTSNQEESKEPLNQEPEKASNQEPEKASNQEPEKTSNQEESKEPLNQEESEKALNQEESQNPLNQKTKEPLNQEESEKALNQEESQDPLNQESKEPLNQEESEKALNQEELQEALPLPPPPMDIPPSATEKAPEDFPPPPHDDSGFQSPTGEVVEVVSNTTSPQPSNEHTGVKETNPAAEPKPSDSETGNQ